MQTLNIQFGDESKTAIVSYFGAPQDPEFWANLGTVDSSDARWKTFYDSQSDEFKIGLPLPA